MVLILTPLKAVSLGATLGHKAHAAFLNTIRDADPALSQALHQPGAQARPFCVSSLETGRRSGGGQLQLSPFNDCWLRFCVLEPAIFQRFMQRFIQPHQRPQLHLGQADLLIREILVTPGAHPWSGYTQWQSLVEEAQAQTEVILEFTSPTAFSFGQKDWGRHIMVLPEPHLVFGSLLRSWNLLAPLQLRFDPDPVKDYLEKHVVVKRLVDVQTRMLCFGSSPQVGFTGRVTFGLKRDDTPVVRQLNTLADFAFYAGVGMKTTMGMGQVRRLTGR